jgi:hypothetical protein
MNRPPAPPSAPLLSGSVRATLSPPLRPRPGRRHAQDDDALHPRRLRARR